MSFVRIQWIVLYLIVYLETRNTRNYKNILKSFKSNVQILSNVELLNLQFSIDSPIQFVLLSHLQRWTKKEIIQINVYRFCRKTKTIYFDRELELGCINVRLNCDAVLDIPFKLLDEATDKRACLSVISLSMFCFHRWLEQDWLFSSIFASITFAIGILCCHGWDIFSFCFWKIN